MSDDGTSSGDTNQEAECQNPDCGYVGPPRVVDYYDADIEVCRVCGWEVDTDT